MVGANCLLAMDGSWMGVCEKVPPTVGFHLQLAANRIAWCFFLLLRAWHQLIYGC